MKDIDDIKELLDFLVEKGRDIEEIEGFIESSSSEKHIERWSKYLFYNLQMVENAKHLVINAIENMMPKQNN
jgi:hypothetical protein